MPETPETRRRIMQAVKSQDTRPEMLVRRALHARGFRYRLHRRALPGKPDLVFPGRKKVIFIHGCFWHGHSCSRGQRVPKTNTTYWLEKIERNRARDERVRADLARLGWKSFVAWECELRDQDLLMEKLIAFLG